MHDCSKPCTNVTCNGLHISKCVDAFQNTGGYGTHIAWIFCMVCADSTAWIVYFVEKDVLGQAWNGYMHG